MVVGAEGEGAGDLQKAQNEANCKTTINYFEVTS